MAQTLDIQSQPLTLTQGMILGGRGLSCVRFPAQQRLCLPLSLPLLPGLCSLSLINKNKVFEKKRKKLQ